MKTLLEIDERMDAIEVELRSDEADVSVLKEEVEQLKEARKAIVEKNELRSKLQAEIAQGKGEVVRTFKEDKAVEESDVFATAEYRSAAFKSILGMELTISEKNTMKRAGVNSTEYRAMLTSGNAVLLPTQTMNKIWENVRANHSILSDLTWNRINAVVKIPRHTAITAGDAAVVAEGTCATAEENTFDAVTISPSKITKMVQYSLEMGVMSIDAFEAYIMSEVEARIGHALAVKVVTDIKGDIAVANKIDADTAGTLVLADILEAYGLASGQGNAVVYANSATIWNHIAALQADKAVAFLPNLNDGPVMNLLGRPVKVEDALGAGEILVLFPNEVFLNVPFGIAMKKVEDECFNTSIAGAVLADSALLYDKGAALLTIGTGA